MNNTRLQRFLSDPRVKKALAKKPGDEGFSLIELVVVIAVLAILSAVALPNFLGVQKDGQVAAAKNTLATIVKECVVSGLRNTGTKFGSIQSTQGKLNGYTLGELAGIDSCYQAQAVGDTGLGDYNIKYSSSTGESEKTCSINQGDWAAGCFTDSTLQTSVTAPATGSW